MALITTDITYLKNCSGENLLTTTTGRTGSQSLESSGERTPGAPGKLAPHLFTIALIKNSIVKSRD